MHVSYLHLEQGKKHPGQLLSWQSQRSSMMTPQSSFNGSAGLSRRRLKPSKCTDEDGEDDKKISSQLKPDKRDKKKKGM